jgi:hypothetical protein
MPRATAAAAALIAASALSCAPAPLEPPRQLAVTPPPAVPPSATPEPTAAPAQDAGPAAPPAVVAPAGPPALPPEDKALGRFRLRARTIISGASRECALPMFHQIAPLAGVLVGWNGKARRLGSATWRYDGAKWTEHPIPDMDVFALSASTEGELWAASHKALFRWDGKAWAKVEIGLDPRIDIQALAAGGAKDVWIVAQPPADASIKVAPLPATGVLRWDGARLARAAVDAPEPGAQVRVQEIRSNGDQVWIWELEAAFQLVRPVSVAQPEPAVYVHPNPPR